MGLNNMSSLLWLLAIGGLFFWMMRRGGCGAHGGQPDSGHSHGGGGGETNDGRGHSGDSRSSHPSRVILDPVCGMEVDPAIAAETRMVGGRRFHLCSQACAEKFDREPSRYSTPAEARGEPSPAHVQGHTGHRHRGGC